jgi:hypothetical protein
MWTGFRVALSLLTLLAVPARADEFLPDLSRTPGAYRHELTLAKICATRWGADERHVSEAMKKKVFRRYGLSGNDDPWCSPNPDSPRRCEIDHLISRELGGADTVENLWPQRYNPAIKWNATRKDKVENQLNKEVCAGRLTLKQAREEIVKDWRVPYRRYYGEP